MGWTDLLFEAGLEESHVLSRYDLALQFVADNQEASLTRRTPFERADENSHAFVEMWQRHTRKCRLTSAETFATEVSANINDLGHLSEFISRVAGEERNLYR